MFFFYFYQKKINDIFYDIKIDKKYKLRILQLFSLEKNEEVKEYWENNVQVIATKYDLSFQYIEDIHISIDERNKLLIQECKVKECIKYNLYKVNQEENYILYKKEIDDITVLLKEYENHLELLFMCNEKECFYNKKIINIYYNIYINEN